LRRLRLRLRLRNKFFVLGSLFWVWTIKTLDPKSVSRNLLEGTHVWRRWDRGIRSGDRNQRDLCSGIYVLGSLFRGSDFPGADPELVSRNLVESRHVWRRWDRGIRSGDRNQWGLVFHYRSARCAALVISYF
jgi:hypothetical protein